MKDRVSVTLSKDVLEAVKDAAEERHLKLSTLVNQIQREHVKKMREQDRVKSNKDSQNISN